MCVGGSTRSDPIRFGGNRNGALVGIAAASAKCAMPRACVDARVGTIEGGVLRPVLMDRLSPRKDYGNHVPVRSRDEGGAWEVGATTSRVSDSVIQKKQGAGQMAVPHHGRRYDFTCVFQIPSQISILNLKFQPKSKVRVR